MLPQSMSLRAVVVRNTRRQETGAAALITVMLLFLVISLAAAYTSRNMIFEQRTSVNQYRSTQVNDAAEAGLEWATAMLNGGRVSDTCAPIADSTKDTFRDRYLNTTAAGNVQARYTLNPSFSMWSACVFDGSNWTCSCPSSGLPVLSAPTGPGPFPAFAVRFVSRFNPTGVARIEVNGCYSLNPECLYRLNSAPSNFCRTHMCATQALHSAAKGAPLAALTAVGAVTGDFSVVNGDAAGGGITVRSGSAAPSPMDLSLAGPAGTPAAMTSVFGDTTLSSLNPHGASCVVCMFSAVFGLSPESYRKQPAVLELNCASGCTSTQVQAALQEHPRRMLWLRGGGLTIDGSSDIGTAAIPVVIIAEGPITLNTSAVVYGLLFGEGLTFSAGTLRGAAVSTGGASGSVSSSVVYDSTVIFNIQYLAGSYVRVPISWQDFV
jgi:hypothetical protein